MSFLYCLYCSFFFLMLRRPPRSTRTDTLFPYPTLFRSIDKVVLPACIPTGITFSPENINKFTPSFSGTFAINWILPIHPADGDLVFDADLFSTADFGGQNGEKLPGYNLVNSQLTWRNVASSGLDLGVLVKNVFNEKYYEIGRAPV